MNEYLQLTLLMITFGGVIFPIHFFISKRFKSSRIISLIPIFVTFFLVIWTISVSPYSEYGDMWAIYPAVLVLPFVFWWHIFLCFKRQEINSLFSRVEWSSMYMGYGIIHLLILFPVWLYCMTLISKDSL